MKLYNYFENKKVLITGNTGFKGSWLTLWMLKMNAQVYGISDRIPTDPSMFENLELEKRINHQFCDVRDYQKIQESILRIQPDYVFHLAAQPIVSEAYADPLTTLETNIMGTAHILESLKKLEKECIVIIVTSDKCYENIEQVWGYRETDHIGGRDIYSSSKGSAELIMHSYYHSFFNKEGQNIRVASARAGNVIGGGDFSKDRLIPDCMRAWSNKQKVTIRNPKSIRPWQHVLEPLGGYIYLASKLKDNKKFNGESFNFGPYSELSETVHDVITALCENWGFADCSDAYNFIENQEFNEAGFLKLNCDKALHILKWRSVMQHHETIKRTKDWYINFFSLKQDMFQVSMSQISDYENLGNQRNAKWAAK